MVFRKFNMVLSVVDLALFMVLTIYVLIVILYHIYMINKYRKYKKVQIKFLVYKRIIQEYFTMSILIALTLALYLFIYFSK